VAYRGCYLGFRVVLVESPIPTPKDSGSDEKKQLPGDQGVETTVDDYATSQSSRPMEHDQ
jgi:hypothetical protein